MMNNVKKEWKEAIQNILDYFNKKGIKIKIQDSFAEAYYKKDNSLLCSCNINENDIIREIIRLKPEYKTKELDELEKKLDQAYQKNIKMYTENWKNVSKNKIEWEKAKKDITDYFERNGIAIDIVDEFATAYNKNDKSTLCSCFLNEDDIITCILNIKPELKTKELKNLEEKLNETYKKYTDSIIKSELENKKEQTL